eukprot:1105876-Amphidinium_carterae.1
MSVGGLEEPAIVWRPFDKSFKMTKTMVNVMGLLTSLPSILVLIFQRMLTRARIFGCVIVANTDK